LSASQTASLDGKLQLILSSSLAESSLPDNASLTMLTAANSGQFAEPLPRLEDGRAFVARYDSNQVVLQLGRKAVWDGNTDGDGDGITWEMATNWSNNQVRGPRTASRSHWMASLM